MVCDLQVVPHGVLTSVSQGTEWQTLHDFAPTMLRSLSICRAIGLGHEPMVLCPLFFPISTSGRLVFARNVSKITRALQFAAFRESFVRWQNKIATMGQIWRRMVKKGSQLRSFLSFAAITVIKLRSQTNARHDEVAVTEQESRAGHMSRYLHGENHQQTVGAL